MSERCSSGWGNMAILEQIKLKLTGIFTKQKSSKLEELLISSYGNELKKYALMKGFLSSRIYFKGMKKGKEIFLNYYENSLLAFTSLETLRRAQQLEKDYILEFVPKILQIMPAGIRLLLNTGPNYGKEFLPGELKFLRAGKIPPDLTHAYKLQPGQKYTISIPEEVPQKLIDALFERIKKCENIERAYLAKLKSPSDQKPNFIVGIKVYNEMIFEQDIISVTDAVKGILGPNEFVDFVQIKEKDTTALEYIMMNEVKPFFDREYLS